MRFLVEWRLFLLVGVAALAVAWAVASMQRRRHVVRFTNVELLDVVAPTDPGWRRHLPAALFLAALVALVLGFAEPVRATEVGEERATVVLAVDVSLSMAADDVAPSRIDVARQAARDFVAELPDDLHIGLVTFNGSTSVAVAPTQDRDALVAGVDALELGEGTAIGEAIYTSLDAIDGAPRGEDDEPAPARIVVMSDGETTQGRDNADAAAAAAEAGVPVDTIAFGTPDGTIEDEFGGTEPVPVAPEPLAEIAATAGGTAFEAESLGELSSAYTDIGGAVGYEERDVDVSGWFVGSGLALLVLAGSLSLLWSQRLP